MNCAILTNRSFVYVTDKLIAGICFVEYIAFIRVICLKIKRCSSIGLIDKIRLLLMLL